MSYMELIAFKNGKPSEARRYSNSWGGAAYVWDKLYRTYLLDPDKPYDNWLVGSEKLWRLWESPALEDFERSVLIATFDYATIKRDNFLRMANDLRAFMKKYEKGDKACHLLSWAEQMESSARGDFEKAEAFGFYHTSVSDNLWITGYNKETDEPKWYDLTTGIKHFNVYELLENFFKKGEQNGTGVSG